MKAPSSGFAHLSSSAKALATFPPKRDFSSLSIKDLLDAREAYHVQLSSLENVVATAIGRYLIHKDDWYASHSPDVPRPANLEKPKEARTLDNSVIRAWSWPAVLVFVRAWGDPKKLGSEAVPRSLYLPDGRVIPTCVVLAAPDESLPPPAVGPSQVSQMVGGGYSCLRSDQGVDHLGTFACLVDREGSYFALTNRHVAGPVGAEIKAYIGGQYVRVGESVDIGLSKLRMSNAFRTWSGLGTRLAFDAGLVRIDKLSDWTSQTFGIGEIGEIFSATEHSLTLDLIGTPLRAFGGTSGVMEGEIRALFFQYKSVGGADYATDVLIGAREPDKSANPRGPLTRPGDSGTLWFYDPPSAPPPPSPDVLAHEEAPDRGLRARRLRPIAMQWGGQRFVDEKGKSSAFALGSFLSTVCRELEFEIVRNWSTGHSEYWGKLGHFAIGWKACDYVSGGLKTLMGLNQERIGFGDETLGAGAQFTMGRDAFVPLADVSDYVWVHAADRGFEGIQHFADIDIHDIDGGATMLKRCHDDGTNCSATKWKAYFDGFQAAGVGPDDGALPFRVWQIWEAMVAYLKQKDVIRFVAAAGVLAHYVGDASQPLHCSYMHHGIPPMKKHAGRNYPVRKGTAEFNAFKKTPAADVHGIYEENMLEVDTPTALVSVNNLLDGVQIDPNSIRSGFDAAKATLALMYDAQKRLPPKKIIAADDPTLQKPARAQRLWNNTVVRKATIESLAQSVKVLATMWQAAWKAGGGSTLPAESLVKFEEKDLNAIYRREKDFLKSLSLDEMASSGDFEPPP